MYLNQTHISSHKVVTQLPKPNKDLSIVTSCVLVVHRLYCESQFCLQKEAKHRVLDKSFRVPHLHLKHKASTEQVLPRKEKYPTALPALEDKLQPSLVLDCRLDASPASTTRNVKAYYLKLTALIVFHG